MQIPNVLPLRVGRDIDHPVNTEFVCEHAERVPPELFGKWHVNFATLRKLVEEFS
jgi:hypothetical protein